MATSCAGLGKLPKPGAAYLGHSCLALQSAGGLFPWHQTGESDKLPGRFEFGNVRNFGKQSVSRSATDARNGQKQLLLSFQLLGCFDMQIDLFFEQFDGEGTRLD